MKIERKPSTALLPTPVVLLTSPATAEAANIITLAWVGMVCSTPPMISVAIRPSRHSYAPRERGARVRRQHPARRPGGGRSTWPACSRATSTTSSRSSASRRAPASQVAAPLIDECPINLECVVRHQLALGAHDLFIAEIVAVHYDEEVLDARGRLKTAELDAWPTWTASTGRWASGSAATARRRRPSGPRRSRLERRALLHHHSHLLRQRRAPPGARLHDHRRRHPGALPPPEGRRRLLPHRRGRARQQGRPGRGRARPHAAAARRPAGAALPGARAPAQRHQRLLHPHHRPRARGLRAAVRRAPEGGRRHREAHLRRPLLHRLRGLLVRARPGADGTCPDHGIKPVWLEEENYYFLLSKYQDRLAEFFRAQPRLREAAGRATTRPCRSSSRASTTSPSAAPASPGACRCRGTRSRSSTCGSTRSSTTSRRSPTRAPART